MRRFILTNTVADDVHDEQLIAIDCPMHGLFVETAVRHLSGYGCPICGGGCSATVNVPADLLVNLTLGESL